MKSFILVSFAFLAFAFYELSDGADFQPPVAPAPPVVVTQTVTTPLAPAPSIKPQPVEAATLIASPIIEPLDEVPAFAPIDVEAILEPDIETVTNLDQVRTSLGQGLSLFPASDPIAQPLMLASLEQGVAGLRDAPVAEVDTEIPEVVETNPPPADIREVSGTRVNMRDGPGTIYPVVMRLTLGHEVEVLGDSGTGWLRLRTLPERTTGWIAASLISRAGQ
jgi:SH3 domain-containing protein